LAEGVKMKRKEFIITPGYDPVRPSVDEVSAIMGYKPGASPSFIGEHLENLLEEASGHSSAAGCYCFFKVKEISIARGLVITDAASIKCGPKIARQLSGSEMVALFVATAGTSFDEWIREKGSKDIMAEYYCSSIGSVIADKVADLIEAEILNYSKSADKGITNRYSPGYCNWNIREQKMIFELLPAWRIGVELNASFLMNPVKSVSGIIGIGAGLTSGEYMCDICDMTNCLVKRARGY
jgi:hypothetical protein